MAKVQTITGRMIELPRVCFAITLTQPWATWIALGWKRIETRDHPRFAWLQDRRIAIHAGKTWDRDWIDTAGPYLLPDQIEKTHELAFDVRGAVVCLVVVDKARQLRPEDAAAALCECSPLRFGLVLGAMSAFAEPIPARGAQGAWRWRPGPEPGPAEQPKTLFER